LSYGMNGDLPMRRLVEPVPEVYQGVSEEGLHTLQANFQKLQDAGCLTDKGKSSNGVGAYDVKTWCMQKSFITRVLTPFIFLLFLISTLLVTGRMVLSWLRFRPKRLLVEVLMSVAIGVCALISLLWLMAVVSFHIPFFSIYTAVGGWLLLFLLLMVGLRHARYWLQQVRSVAWEFHGKWYSPTVLLVWLLISYLAFNFLTVIRPFPIGWDDLGSYLNRPRLLVSYGHFIYSMAAFQWEYITSLGFLLFGYENNFSSTIAMVINWAAGLLAVVSVFTFTNIFLGRGKGILAALLYYTLPLVGHFSFADMKIDNAVFSFGLLSLLCVFVFLFCSDEQEVSNSDQPAHNWKWLIVAGIFGGFAFGMKPTSIMMLMATGAVMLGVLLHWSAFLGAAFLAIFFFSFQGVLSFESVAERITGGDALFSQTTFLIFVLLFGLGFLGYAAWRARMYLKMTTRAIFTFGIAFFICIAPWILHNNILYGNVIPNPALLGAPNNVTPILDITGTEVAKGSRVIHALPPELVVDQSKCVVTGKEEELDRYWGFRQGWGHYLKLPWRLVMNLDSLGYYVTTMPGLLLVPLILLLPFFWMRKNRWLRWLLLGTGFMLLEWMFLANGIPWYGIGTFLGLVVILEVLTAKAPDLPNRIAMGALLFFSFLVVFNLRFWQYETQRNLLEYAIGKSSSEVMVERTVPYYNDIAKIVVERNQAMPDRPYLFRVGTFIPYFIPRNLELIGIGDHQLDFFNCLHNERDDELTLKRLQTLGFNSIIFDTNTATIEKDPNGSLHEKMNHLINFLNRQDLGINVIISDTKAGVAYILLP